MFLVQISFFQNALRTQTLMIPSFPIVLSDPLFVSTAADDVLSRRLANLAQQKRLLLQRQIL